MNCSELADRLTDLLEGDLNEDDEAAALEHLATCSACETVLAGTQQVVALVKDHGQIALSSTQQEALWNRVLSDTLRPGPSAVAGEA